MSHTPEEAGVQCSCCSPAEWHDAPVWPDAARLVDSQGTREERIGRVERALREAAMVGGAEARRLAAAELLRWPSLKIDVRDAADLIHARCVDLGGGTMMGEGTMTEQEILDAFLRAYNARINAGDKPAAARYRAIAALHDAGIDVPAGHGSLAEWLWDKLLGHMLGTWGR